MHVRSSFKLAAHSHESESYYDKINLIFVWNRGDIPKTMHDYLMRYNALLGENCVCLAKIVCYGSDGANLVFGPIDMHEIATTVYDDFNLDELTDDTIVIKMSLHFLPRDSRTIGNLVLKQHEKRDRCRCEKREKMLELIDRIGPLGFERL